MLAFGRLVWCPGPLEQFDVFAAVDHDGDPLVVGSLSNALDLPPLEERQQVLTLICTQLNCRRMCAFVCMHVCTPSAIFCAFTLLCLRCDAICCTRLCVCSCLSVVPPSLPNPPRSLATELGYYQANAVQLGLPLDAGPAQ